LPLPPLPSGISPGSIQAKLVKADFTGINLLITSSRNPSLIGIKGIVIEETASTFRLVTMSDKVKVVPKDGTMFRISFPAYSPRPVMERVDGEVSDPVDIGDHIERSPQIQVNLLGSAFGFRSGDRAGKKFRPAQGGGGGSGWGEEWVDGDWARTLRLLEDVTSVSTSGVGAMQERKRKRGKSRRKDPPAWGAVTI